MKCVETFKNREAATERQRLLTAQGIESRIAVDPLSGRYEALSHFLDVALMVGEGDFAAAQRTLGSNRLAG